MDAAKQKGSSVKNYYPHQSTVHELALLHNGKISDAFSTNSGVRQGCLLSPLLFAIVLDDIMNQLTL